MLRPRRIKLRSVYTWHRYVGITCAILVLILSVTGLLLQHSDALDLPDQFPQSDLIQSWYGISTDNVVSFNTANHWISQSGSSLFIDANPVKGKYDYLYGVIETDFGFAVAHGLELTLLTEDGDLIESLSAGNGLPEAVRALAIVDDEIVVRGLYRNWKTDESFLSWQVFSDQPDWIKATIAPDHIRRFAQDHNMKHQISWERLLLDLHSGRLFGRYAVWIMDAAAIGLLFLSCSGCWLWIQSRRKYKQHRK
ncbi:MAG: PepSY domain-containing protein [Gammaproteobacteria bacterium]|nr:PepSY domain-containing protein [Gammaproteobacteria bacterium]